MTTRSQKVDYKAVSVSWVAASSSHDRNQHDCQLFKLAWSSMSSPELQITFTQEEMCFPGRLHWLKCEPCSVELRIGAPIQGACKHQVWCKWLLCCLKPDNFEAAPPYDIVVWASVHCKVANLSKHMFVQPIFHLKKSEPQKLSIFVSCSSIRAETVERKPILGPGFSNCNLFWMPWLYPTPMDIIRLHCMQGQQISCQAWRCCQRIQVNDENTTWCIVAQVSPASQA